MSRALNVTSPASIRHRLCLVAVLSMLALTGCSQEVPGNEMSAAVTQWQTTSNNALYLVTIAPLGDDIPIGDYHPWTIQLNDTNGTPVSSAAIRVDGGMPAHGHGLPSQPEVTQHIGDGRFLIEGMRFNMAGEWVMQFQIQSNAGADTARFELELSY